VLPAAGSGNELIVHLINLLSREPVEKQISSCDLRDVLHKFVVALVVVMTELNRSDIAMWFPLLTDLVFFGAYGGSRSVSDALKQLFTSFQSVCSLSSWA
jgi:hypothetical protein